MGLENLKRVLQDRQEAEEKTVTEHTTSGGRRVRIVTTTESRSFKEIGRETLRDYHNMGFDLRKLKKAGFDPETCNPDDFCSEEFERD